MLTKAEVLLQLKTTLPGVPIKAWTQYQDIYLFRVEWPDLAEKNWDPFVSVDPLTGEVRDYSVLTDGNLSEIAALEWQDI